MATQYLTCPLCGFEFDKDETLCSHGCPMGTLCNLVRCPSCDYEFPETPRAVSFVRKLLSKSEPQLVESTEGIRTLRDLKRGECARVMCLGARRASRHETLSVFGLELGAEVTLLQQRPSCVVQVGETTLALDTDIAKGILVRPVACADGGDRQGQP